MASAIARTSTPPPPSSIRTPPTPKHAGDYEPYSPPRKSSRISSQRAQRQAQTPPPYSSHKQRATSTPSTSNKTASTNMPNSPPLTIVKKRVQAFKDSRRVSGSLTEDTMASAASALGLPPKQNESKAEGSRRSVTIRNQGMLPTPDKTPRKTPAKTVAGISSIARNLFPSRQDPIEDLMPSPKKPKKYNGFTLDSFGAEDVDEPIQIYTDSQERVPEVDTSEENPFYNVPAVPEPTKRASKRRKVMVQGEGEEAVEGAEKREDGLVYVFRGKKFFRKFDEDKEEGQELDSEDAELDAELDATVPARLRGSLSRSAIKPRLLFPPAEHSSTKSKQLGIPDDDEEAVTDIEEIAQDVSTPSDHVDNAAATPKAPRFAPASPPTTGRAKRSKRIGSSSPAGPPSEGEAGRRKVSPFDSWQRTKGIAATDGSKSKKRDGESSMFSEGPAAKRRQRLQPS